MREDVVEVGLKVRFEAGDVTVTVDYQALAVFEQPDADPFGTDVLGS